MTKTRQRLTAFSPNECSRPAPWLEDRDAADFGATYDPPSGVTQRGLIDWPQAIIGLTALVYVAFVVQLAMWGVQWLYHAVN